LFELVLFNLNLEININLKQIQYKSKMENQEMKTRINKIRRKLTTSINKLEMRSNIQDHITQNHKNKINDINVSLITLELQVQDLQHTINKYLNSNRSITEDALNEINVENLTNKTINNFLPYMMMFMMINDPTSILNQRNAANTANTANTDINDINDID